MLNLFLILAVYATFTYLKYNAMKKINTYGTENEYTEALQERYAVNTDLIKRKDMIMKYIQISVACLIALLVCTGLYDLIS